MGCGVVYFQDFYVIVSDLSGDPAPDKGRAFFYVLAVTYFYRLHVHGLAEFFACSAEDTHFGVGVDVP